MILYHYIRSVYSTRFLTGVTFSIHVNADESSSRESFSSFPLSFVYFNVDSPDISRVFKIIRCELNRFNKYVLNVVESLLQYLVHE